MKGLLFLVLGVGAAVGLLLEAPRWRVAFLLALAIWGLLPLLLLRVLRDPALRG